MAYISLVLLAAVACFQVSVGRGQNLDSNTDRASLILSALCMGENGEISDDCLSGLASRNLYNSFYPIGTPRRSRGSTSANSDVNAALPAKRGREEKSGFYSNW